MASRVENAKRNIIFAVLSRMVGVLFPFAIRTVMLYILGTEYLGLDSLFASVLNFLSLAELGVGSALVYSMYKPIADHDTDQICALYMCVCVCCIHTYTHESPSLSTILSIYSRTT